MPWTPEIKQESPSSDTSSTLGEPSRRDLATSSRRKAPKPLFSPAQRRKLFKVLNEHTALLRKHANLVDDLTREGIMRDSTTSHPEIDHEILAISEHAKKAFEESKNSRGRIADIALGRERKPPAAKVLSLGRDGIASVGWAPVEKLSQKERDTLRKKWSFKSAGTGAECFGDAVLPGASARKVRFEDDDEHVEEPSADEEGESVNSGAIPESIENTRVVFGTDGEEHIVTDQAPSDDQAGNEPVDQTMQDTTENQPEQDHSTQDNEQNQEHETEQDANAYPSDPQIESSTARNPTTVEEDDITEEVNRRLARNQLAREMRLASEEAKANGTARGDKRKRSLSNSSELVVAHRAKKARTPVADEQALGGGAQQWDEPVKAQWEIFLGRGLDNKRTAEKLMAMDCQFLGEMKERMASSRRKLIPTSVANATPGKLKGKGKARVKVNEDKREPQVKEDAKPEKRSLSQVIYEDVVEDAREFKKAAKRRKRASRVAEKRKLADLSGNENAGTATVVATAEDTEGRSKRRKTTPLDGE